MRVLIKVILVVFLFLNQLSCADNKVEDKLEGHWHRVQTDAGSYQTLDIEDTVTLTDKYNLNGGLYVEYERVDKDGRLILPSDFYEESDTFSIKHDTLVISHNARDYRYIRADINKCIINDRYYNCYLKISLEDLQSAEDFEKSYKYLCSNNLYIGKLKNPWNEALIDLVTERPDSVFIQANEVLISLNNIPQFCDLTMAMCSPNDSLVNINLHIDKQVSDEFRDKIISLIPNAISLHRIVKIENKEEIGLIRIR